MRTVTYGAACSLDGFIAPPDGSMDWLHFSRDVQDVMSKYWESIDTMLMGRKTWDVAVGNTYIGEMTDIGPGGITFATSTTLQRRPVAAFGRPDCARSERWRSR